MKRDSYLSLCGDWTLAVERGKRTTALGTVRVPFPPESDLSLVGRPLKKNECYVYEKRFTLTEKSPQHLLLLHFDAVDQIAEVTLNGHPICTHVGGYLPFEADVTDAAVSGENLLRVRVTDRLDTELCYGKQRKKRGGMWYTPISGIWQPVWLESVPTEYIRSIRITPTLTEATLEIEGGKDSKHLFLETPNGTREYTFTGNRFTLCVDNPILWSPEQPHLYHFTLTDGSDTVSSYFALRTVDVQSVNGKPHLCLNGKPYFFHGLLDQGYYSDGIYLPATPDGYRFDIQKMKSMGFNTLRKHIKIEPDVFYYECDRLGMIVFQDMVNNGHYSFLLDTALPTLGMKKGFAHRASKRRRANFEGSAKETLRLLYNHPSVCYYTIFNEGWGQYKGAERIYEELKALDPTRIYDTASGWFQPAKSDVQSEHVYFKPIALKSAALPLVLSEFGGYSCKLEGHAFNLDKTYGYRTCKTPQELEDALVSLYQGEIIPAIEQGLCAAILTQVSDVEDETNGLVTYDRHVVKVSAARMRSVADALRTAFEKTV